MKYVKLCFDTGSGWRTDCLSSSSPTAILARIRNSLSDDATTLVSHKCSVIGAPLNAILIAYTYWLYLISRVSRQLHYLPEVWFYVLYDWAANDIIFVVVLWAFTVKVQCSNKNKRRIFRTRQRETKKWVKYTRNKSWSVNSILAQNCKYLWKLVDLHLYILVWRHIMTTPRFQPPRFLT